MQDLRKTATARESDQLHSKLIGIFTSLFLTFLRILFTFHIGTSRLSLRLEKLKKGELLEVLD